MSNTGDQIAELLKDTGKSAPDMTHALAQLGGGSMQNGLARIGQYFSDEVAVATTRGRVQGGIAGALATIVIGGLTYCAVQTVKKAKKHEMEGEQILHTMECARSGAADDSLNDSEQVVFSPECNDEAN